MFLHGLAQQRIQLLLCVFKSPLLLPDSTGIPIWKHFETTVNPFQEVRGRKFLDSLEDRLRTRNIIDTQEAVQRIDIDLARHGRVFENGFDLRPKVNVVSRTMEKQRLNPNTIARQHKPLLGLGPDTKSEHSSKTTEAFRIPFAKCLQHNLGVAVRCEAAAACNQFGAEFGVVVDLAVENEDDIAILADHRLFPSGQIDDLQTN